MLEIITGWFPGIYCHLFFVEEAIGIETSRQPLTMEKLHLDDKVPDNDGGIHSNQQEG